MEMPDRPGDRDGVCILVPSWSGVPSGVRAAVSTRIGGVSRDPFGMNTSFRVGDREEDVRVNRERFFAAAGAVGGRIATVGQVHGADVVPVDRPGHYPGFDALVTATRGLWLGVSVADCVPILLYDEEHGAIGAVHSGWRGTRENIVGKCVSAMTQCYSTRPGALLAFIGPAAGGCCYEVGEEVGRHFPVDVVTPAGGGKFRLDLVRRNRNLLTKSGVPPERVECSDRCTIHEAATFHSYRRDGEDSGRMLAIVGIAES